MVLVRRERLDHASGTWKPVPSILDHVPAIFRASRRIHSPAVLQRVPRQRYSIRVWALARVRMLRLVSLRYNHAVVQICSKKRAKHTSLIYGLAFSHAASN